MSLNLKSSRKYRTIFNQTVLLITLTTIVSLTAIAQSPDKILKNAVKAMGGEKALRSIKSWRVKGTITDLRTGDAGSYTAAAQQPSFYTRTFDMRGLETSVGYSGRSGWMRDSRDGLRTLTGLYSRDFQAEVAWRNNRWLDYKKEKAKTALAGPVTIGEKSASSIALTTSKNVRIKMYFDTGTGLLIREELPAAETTRIFDYSDFRPVNGVMEPHEIRVTEGESKFLIKLQEITHNSQLNKALFDFPTISNEPLPDIPMLLKQVGENEDEIDSILEKYTYTETITRREIDSKGEVKDKDSEKFELTFYRGNRLRRQIEKNGKPLSSGDDADETKRLEKRIREIEKKEAEKEKKAQKDREVAQSTAGPPDPERGQRISISDVLKASKLINPRRERFRGRDVIVFDFEPLPGYKPQKDFEKFFGKMAGAIWVDAADKQVVRVEARLIESFKVGGGLLASLREGATFVLEQERVNNEIWLPTRADINLGVKVLLVKGINVNSSVVYGDYKRFNVESEKEKLKDPFPTQKPVKP
ncbi:MAG: hypothetical protein IPO77_20255 [Acidobacteria bacterium]|nr:hypothetical protein [Acidobacteriota bacterium]